MQGGMNEAIIWLKSKETEFAMKGNSISSQTSDTLMQKGSGDDKKGKIVKRFSQCDVKLLFL